jgi:predicted N-acyltransferase
VRTLFHRALTEIPAAAWDALHDGRNPFVAHAFLAGLEETGCLREEWGWTPCHAGLWEGDALIAAAPGYLKTNSHGEFVFDHAWAHAYAQHGLDYFPKWLGAVPYSPVTGPRLLARGGAMRRELLEAIAGFARNAGLSSAHVNFHEDIEDAAFDPGWLPREDVQYHWRKQAHWRTFEDFLAAMDRIVGELVKRKMIAIDQGKVRYSLPA